MLCCPNLFSFSLSVSHEHDITRKNPRRGFFALSNRVRAITFRSDVEVWWRLFVFICLRNRLSENRVSGIGPAPLLRATGSVAWRNREKRRRRRRFKKKRKRFESPFRFDSRSWRECIRRGIWKTGRSIRPIVRCDWRLSNYQGTASGKSIGKRTERRFVANQLT